MIELATDTRRSASHTATPGLAALLYRGRHRLHFITVIIHHADTKLPGLRLGDPNRRDTVARATIEPAETLNRDRSVAVDLEAGGLEPICSPTYTDVRGP